jgi:hypothetical protein
MGVGQFAVTAGAGVPGWTSAGVAPAAVSAPFRRHLTIAEDRTNHRPAERLLTLVEVHAGMSGRSDRNAQRMQVRKMRVGGAACAYLKVTSSNGTFGSN